MWLTQAGMPNYLSIPLCQSPFVKRSDRSIDGGVSLETFVSAEIFLKRKTLKKKAAAARHIF